MSAQLSPSKEMEARPPNAAITGYRLADGAFDATELVQNFEVLAEAAGGIAELRRLILALGVRGRLTSGRSLAPADGTDQHPFVVPGGWTWRRLEECAALADGPFGSKLKSEHYIASPGFRVLRLGNLGVGEFKDDDRSFIQRGHYESLRPYHLNADDILVASLGNPPGRACLVPRNALPAVNKADCFRVRVTTDELSAQFLVRVLNSDYALARAAGLHRGDTRGRITLAHLRETPIPLPPLAEQKRIVAKVDQLMALCDELEARQTKKRETGTRLTKSALEALTTAETPEDFDRAWTRVSDNFDLIIDRAEAVEALKSAVVDLASRGRLVRPAGGDSVAKMLSLRSRERRLAWEQQELERLRRSGRTPKNEKWRAAYAEPTFAAPPLPPLPDGWEYVAIGLLGDDPFSPVQTGPFGAQLHSSEFASTGVPVIAVGNLTGTGFTRDGLYFITEKKASQLSRYDVQAGDLLFARSGATLGKVCVAPDYVKDWRMTGHILRVRLDPRVISSELAALWMWSSAAVKEQIVATIRGGTRPGYNTTLLESIVLPVPPLEEQQRILDRLHELLACCDALEKSVLRSEAAAERLAKILAAEAAA